MRYWESQKPKPRSQRKASGARPKSSVASGGSLRNYSFLRKFYQHQTVIGSGLQKFLFFLVMATLLYAFVFGDAGAIRIIALRQERAEFEVQVATIEKNIAALQAEIAALKADPFKMERLGRERYGYMYPGDKVYKLIRPRTK